ncbi:hypothetical protein K438DRAFT_1788400 [Mycena galopus ATCC 62051]|nr:hypothetical protein K438DRAFT_1788400 [Mycena galopus ATCC 62051]
MFYNKTFVYSYITFVSYYFIRFHSLLDCFACHHCRILSPSSLAWESSYIFWGILLCLLGWARGRNNHYNCYHWDDPVVFNPAGRKPESPRVVTTLDRHNPVLESVESGYPYPYPLENENNNNNSVAPTSTIESSVVLHEGMDPASTINSYNIIQPPVAMQPVAEPSNGPTVHFHNFSVVHFSHPGIGGSSYDIPPADSYNLHIPCPSTNFSCTPFATLSPAQQLPAPSLQPPQPPQPANISSSKKEGNKKRQNDTDMLSPAPKHIRTLKTDLIVTLPTSQLDTEGNHIMVPVNIGQMSLQDLQVQLKAFKLEQPARKNWGELIQVLKAYSFTKNWSKQASLFTFMLTQSQQTYKGQQEGSIPSKLTLMGNQALAEGRIPLPPLPVPTALPTDRFLKATQTAEKRAQILRYICFCLSSWRLDSNGGG